MMFLIVALATGTVAAQDRPKSLEQQAKSQVGTVATICGTVMEYLCQRPERTSLLALDKPLSGAGVSIGIAREDRKKFGTGFEQQQILREVCATGTVEKRKNRYIIRVRDPAQLRLATDSASSVRFGGDSFSSCDEGVELPKLVREVKPEYTEAALNAKIQGVVLLEGVIQTDGQVGDIRILRSLDAKRGLDDQAVKALRAWRFDAGTRDGRPVPVVVTVELSFRLK